MGFVYCVSYCYQLFSYQIKSCIYQSHPNAESMYYIVNGIAQSIIFGISSMENIPYHFTLFYSYV